MQNPTFQQIGNGKYLVREADAHHFVSYHPDLVGAPLMAARSTIADKARAGERMAPIAVMPPAGAVARPAAGVSGKRGPLKNRSVSDRKMLTDLGREALGRETRLPSAGLRHSIPSYASYLRGIYAEVSIKRRGGIGHGTQSAACSYSFKHSCSNANIIISY